MEFLDTEQIVLLLEVVCLLVVLIARLSAKPLRSRPEDDPLAPHVPRTPSPRALAADLWAHVRAPKDQRILPPLDPKFAAVRKTPKPEFEIEDFSHSRPQPL